jgi:hypothetical protein
MTRLKRSILSILLACSVSLQVPLVALAIEGDPAATTEPAPVITSEPAPATETVEPAPVVETTPTTTSSETTAVETETVTATPPPPPPPPAPETGPAKPTGSDAGAYVYNAQTGKWESDKYIWDPATGQTQPKYDSGYYFNPETGRWDTTKYEYHPESGKYEPVTTSLTSPPPGSAGATASGAPNMAKMLAQLLGLPDPSNNDTGPNSINTASTSSSATGFFDLFSRTAVTNTLNSAAASGNASVDSNTLGGNATSGPAQVIANLLNLLNSAWGWASGGLTTFSKNIYGNHFGDINLNPGSAPAGGGGCVGGCSWLSPSGQLVSNSNTGPDSTNTASSTNANDLTVNYRADGEINNNLNLLAQSGNASVTGNTVGGSALSGDALVQLNMLNLINSMIGSGQSFFGLINIFGNLNGDILFPVGFLDSVATSSCSVCANGGGTLSNTNTGPNSTNTASNTNSTNLDVNNQTLAGFNNNINTAAASGNATVSGNTQAGSAASGDAATRNNLFNLANTNIFGDNAILVLVNVMGHWIGGIMNLGSLGGSSSALLTGNAVVSNDGTGPNSANTANNSTTTDATLNSNVTGRINNNVMAGALSGDATVEGNTSAGGATSGDATVVSNVANIFNSSFNLDKWFGVLVVNVFGDWTGSVNKDTDAGENVPQPVHPLQTSPLGSAQAVNTPGVGGAPKAGVTDHNYAANNGSAGGTLNAPAGNGNQVRGKDSKSNARVASLKRDVAGAAKADSRTTGMLLMFAALSLMLASAFLGLEKKLKKRR